MMRQFKRLTPALVLVLALSTFAPSALAQSGSRASSASSGIVGWVFGGAVRSHFEKRGAKCYNPPRWLPGPFNAAWYVGTCAYPAR